MFAATSFVYHLQHLRTASISRVHVFVTLLKNTWTKNHHLIFTMYCVMHRPWCRPYQPYARIILADRLNRVKWNWLFYHAAWMVVLYVCCIAHWLANRKPCATTFYVADILIFIHQYTGVHANTKQGERTRKTTMSLMLRAKRTMSHDNREVRSYNGVSWHIAFRHKFREPFSKKFAGQLKAKVSATAIIHFERTNSAGV